MALALCACGGPSFNGRVYRAGELTFRVGQIPEGWRRVDSDGALLGFRDDARAATVAVNGRCGLDGDDVPLQSLTHHLFIDFTARQITSQEEQQLDGRQVLRTELSAELDGVPKQFVVYVLKKDGCVYDFWWIGATRDAQSIERFDGFVHGFSTKV